MSGFEIKVSNIKDGKIVGSYYFKDVPDSDVLPAKQIEDIINMVRGDCMRTLSMEAELSDREKYIAALIVEREVLIKENNSLRSTLGQLKASVRQMGL